MHWTTRIAEDIVRQRPNLSEYVVASGITPSGSVHIGNFREFITSYMVGKALQDMGKQVRMIFSWDNFDRFRKVPANITTPGFEQYIGKAVSDIPDPFGKESSYGRHFEKEFEIALEHLKLNEIPVKFIYQSKEYKSGRYNDQIIHALKNRKKIYDIITSFKTQSAEEGERENYYPINIYCPTCGKDFTRVVSFNEATNELEYTCKNDGAHKIDVKKANNIKLVWKTDWPMRWKAEGVCFEPAGPDHMSDGGSHDVSSHIVREIFGFEPPIAQEYGFIGIKGGAVKISSSKGNAPTPGQLLNIYEPEIIKWLFAKYAPRDFFEFGFDDTIIRHYQEYDREHPSDKISFSTLTTIGPLAGFNRDVVKHMIGNDGGERLSKVQYWLENYAPDKIYILRDHLNTEFYSILSKTEKETLKKLHDFLQESMRTEKEIQEFLYSIINNPKLDKKENIALQQHYFKIFYNMLFGRNDGPRLYLYLAAAPREKVLKVLSN